MALALDASTPAKTTLGAAVTSAVSPSFSPPAGSVIYMVLSAEGDVGTQSVSSVTNTGTALTWALLKRDNTAGVPSGSGTAEVWWAYNASSQSSITVTANLAVNTNGAGSDGILQVLVFTGALSNQAAAAAAARANATAATPSLAITTTVDKSWVWAVVGDMTNGTAPTAGASQTVQSNVSVTHSYWCQKQNATTSPTGSVTMNDTAPATVAHDMVVWEVLPAAGSTADSPPTFVRSVPSQGPLFRPTVTYGFDAVPVAAPPLLYPPAAFRLPLRGVPRPRRTGQVAVPPPQLPPPAHLPPAVHKRLRFRPRPRQLGRDFTGPQVVPPNPQLRWLHGPSRRWHGLQSRKQRSSEIVSTPPAVLPNPKIAFTSWVRRRGLLVRKGRSGEIPLTQQPPPPVPFPPNLNVARRRGLLVRKGRAAETVPPVPAPIPTSSPRRRTLLARRPRPAQRVVPVPGPVPNSPITFTSWVRRRGLLVRRGLARLPWPQALKPIFSVGQLTAADRGSGNTATAVGGSDAASSSATAALTAQDQRTGGPS